MKGVRFGLAVIAACGLLVLAAGMTVGSWVHEAEGIASRHDAVSAQLLALERSLAAVPRADASERSRLTSLQGQLQPVLSDLARQRSTKFWHVYLLSALAVLVVDLLVVVAIVSLAVAIHRVRAEQQQSEHEAMHDPLTTMPNRRYLVDWLTRSIAAARRGGQPLALLYIDLDGFKAVNDRLGHDAGDRVLRVTAERLRRALRQSDFVARLGGDEFVAVLREAPTAPGLSVLIDRLQAAITKAPIDELEDGAVNASIGTAWFPDDGEALDTLLAAADRAMYDVKQAHHAESHPATAHNGQRARSTAGGSGAAGSA